MEKRGQKKAGRRAKHDFFFSGVEEEFRIHAGAGGGALNTKSLLREGGREVLVQKNFPVYNSSRKMQERFLKE